MAEGLHRIAGALDRMKREAASGPCRLHPDRPSVGFIQGWDLHPRGVCQACADYGREHGYTIHGGQQGLGAAPSGSAPADHQSQGTPARFGDDGASGLGGQ